MKNAFQKLASAAILALMAATAANCTQEVTDEGGSPGSEDAVGEVAEAMSWSVAIEQYPALTNCGVTTNIPVAAATDCASALTASWNLLTTLMSLPGCISSGCPAGANVLPGVSSCTPDPYFYANGTPAMRWQITWDWTCSACTPPPANMADWWTFDETSGSTAGDTSGVNNVGTKINGPTIIAGQVDNALSFDGVNDFVKVPSHSEVNFFGAAPGKVQSFSIDAWIRIDPAAGSGLKTLLDKRVNASQPQGYAIYIYNGLLGFQMADAAVPGGICGSGTGYPCTNWTATSGYVADGNWHLIAITVDRAASVGTFYVDGASVGTFTPRAGSLVNSAPLIIGGRQPAFGATYFNGDIDELEFFKTALPASTVLDIFNAGSSGKCKTPVCGNGVCEATEDCCACASDCGGGISCC